VELFNPWTNVSQKRPGEFYSYWDTANNKWSWSDGVMLNKVGPGNSPVWRLQVMEGNTADRTVYFTNPTGLTTGDNGNEFFYTTLPVAPLKPGRYAVVGSTGRLIGTEYTTLIGRRTDAIDDSGQVPVTDADLKVSTTRRIVLKPDASSAVQQVFVYNDGTGNVELPQPLEIAEATAVGINQPRSLSITDPVGGYPEGADGSCPVIPRTS